MISFVEKISRFLSEGSIFLGEHGMKMVDSGETTQRKLIESKVPAARRFFRKFPGG